MANIENKHPANTNDNMLNDYSKPSLVTRTTNSQRDFLSSTLCKTPNESRLEFPSLPKDIIYQVNDAVKKESPYKWLILIQLCSLKFLFTGFSIFIMPVSDSIIYAFGVNNHQLNLYNIPVDSFLFFMRFLNIFMVGKIGVKGALLIGIFFISIGTSIDLLMETNFWFIDIGQPVAIIGTQIFSVIHGEVCYRWFNAKQRPIALALALMSKELSPVFNLMIPHLFIINNKTANKDQIRAGAWNFNLFRIILAVCFFFFILIFFREKPKVQGTNENTEN